MGMVSKLGGLDAQPWAYQGYRALLFSPIVLMTLGIGPSEVLRSLG